MRGRGCTGSRRTCSRGTGAARRAACTRPRASSRTSHRPTIRPNASPRRVDAHELWPKVADAVARLPEEERDALLLYVWEELSYEEIASALAVPIGTVRSRLNRARLSLRELRPPIGREP